jgi:HD-like signal output (HDOD) protein
MKTRILFVDDEPRVLEGLEDILLGYRQQWEMVFATSGATALEHMRGAPFDVVVTDIRMPGMDGIALLRIVRDEHPETIRIVLSGHSDMNGGCEPGVLGALPVLHQVLYKPCQANLLEETIERACSLRALIGNESVRKVVGGLKGLPTLPAVYVELQQALGDQQAGARDIARIIQRDIGMSAKVLQLVNSSFFGLGRRIAEIEEAVAYLGTEMVSRIVLAAEVFDRRTPGRGSDQLLCDQLLEGMRDHALLAAAIARRIMLHDRRRAADAWAAGLLHDIGKLVLAAELPWQLASASQMAKDLARPLHEVEQELYGVTHAEIGAYLLGTWGLPYPIVEAVANHHAPERVKHRDVSVLTAVHVADALAHECIPAAKGSPCSLLSSTYINSLGLETRIEEWREGARELSNLVLKGAPSSTR